MLVCLFKHTHRNVGPELPLKCPFTTGQVLNLRAFANHSGIPIAALVDLDDQEVPKVVHVSIPRSARINPH
jgi:hypothetical protein